MSSMSRSRLKNTGKTNCISSSTVSPSIQKDEKRLYEAVEKATQFSDGIVVIAREKEDLFFNLAFAVESTGKSYPPITPQTFSFNHDAGMCLECQGLGMTYGAHFDEQKSFLRLSILDLADRLFKEKGTAELIRLSNNISRLAESIATTPIKNLSA